MSLVRQNRRTERSIKFVIPSENASRARTEGSRCDGLKVTFLRILRLRFASLRMTRNWAPGRLAKSEIPGRARAHEPLLQENGRTVGPEAEANCQRPRSPAAQTRALVPAGLSCVKQL